MKKSTVFAAVAALALASCSNDDVLIKVDQQPDANKVMAFGVGSANMSRDGGSGEPALTGLNEYFYNFGVFAYKGTDATGKILVSEFTDANKVMGNYLVGYYDAGNGGYDYTYNDSYKAAYRENSLWWYDLLGAGQYAGASPYVLTSISVNTQQFLKYWDGSSKYTYFFCTAPYNVAAALACTTDGEAELSLNQTVQMGELNATTPDADYSFFAQVATPKANYGETVKPKFVRVGSKMQFAFYEQINGYSVKINSVTATPKEDDGTTPGQILDSCKPVVTFNTAANTYELSSTNAAGSGNALTFAVDDAAAIGDSKATATFSTTNYRVLPVALDADNTYYGLLVTINYDLIADDTTEVTNITANVMVYADYCQWLNNSLYKYYFKITTNGLTPIIFDECKVANYDNPTNWETLWEVEEGTDPNPSTNW